MQENITVRTGAGNRVPVPKATNPTPPRNREAPGEPFTRQPAHLLKTPAWDQGREMARWADIEAALAIDVYSCEPRSPWQRPSNEQTNGLLRRRPPKGADLDVGTARLSIIEDHLSTMPRNRHHWDSAQSVYTALSRNHW